MRTFVSILLVLCSIVACGQKYMPYIIITKQGEKIECLAEMKNDYITYKIGTDKNKTRLYSSEVMYAAMVEGDSIMLFSGIPVYQQLSSETTPTNIGWVRFLTDPRIESVSVYIYYKNTMFGEELILGCYRQGDDYGQNVFSSAYLKKNKEAMSKYFSDCPSVVEYVNNMRALLMTIDDFKNVVKEYNQCEKTK